MRKQDLKYGDKVTLRDGTEGLVDQYKNVGFDDGYKLTINEKLMNEGGMGTDWDIVKVERPTQYKTIYIRKEEILNEKEKEYLRVVIKPFRNKIKSLVKLESLFGDEEFIQIIVGNDDSALLPNFAKDTMYKNMIQGKTYSLKELSL